MKSKGSPKALSAPVPGMGLTSELGSRPWQRPSEIVTLQEAVPFYLDALKSKKFIRMYLDSIEAGVPITTLVDVMTQAAVMEGKHTIDIGVLVAPIMLEALVVVAEESGIEYVSGLEDEDSTPTSRSSAKAAIAAVFKNADMTEEQEEMREEVAEVVKESSRGLMSKRGEK